MNDETPMSVHTAIALGFCDGILTAKSPKNPQETENKTTIKSLDERLNLIMGGITQCPN